MLGVGKIPPSGKAQISHSNVIDEDHDDVGFSTVSRHKGKVRELRPASGIPIDSSSANLRGFQSKGQRKAENFSLLRWLRHLAGIINFPEINRSGYILPLRVKPPAVLDELVDIRDLIPPRHHPPRFDAVKPQGKADVRMTWASICCGNPLHERRS